MTRWKNGFICGMLSAWTGAALAQSYWLVAAVCFVITALVFFKGAEVE